ncbi:MAG: GtrA family protein [Thermomicrobiales bacterium]|nr:GtrA family protein [Thermomicrobiales bacterium]
MLRTERVPPAAMRTWLLAQRFQKFLLVGAVGLAVNQGLLMLLAGPFGVAVALASPIAILASMAVTFSLNETWTWQDRNGGSLSRRAALYGTINSGGLLINWGLLLFLERHGLHYTIANLIGAAAAAVWNFALNHAITWRSRV